MAELPERDSALLLDMLLAARDALRSEPDDSAREEFERLLQDA